LLRAPLIIAIGDGWGQNALSTRYFITLSAT
jgi:hypothetical protein